jgi:chromate reductase, NAD(P)H dehydrogenase (quinone)
MVELVFLSGSLRHGSMNSAVIRAAVRCAEKHPAVDRISTLSLRGIPLFDEDIEELGDPPAVAAAKQLVQAADSVFIATPEYNGALSGVLKNAIDWLSRPWGSSALTDKPVITVSAAPGLSGGRSGQVTLRQILDELGAWVVPHDLVTISAAHGVFDGKGEIADVEILTRIDLLVATLVASCTDQQSLTVDY